MTQEMTELDSPADAITGGRRPSAGSLPFAWRPMEPDDLDGVHAAGERVHPGYPERIEVFAERLRLYPEGCHVLEMDGGTAGYVISHPWHPMMPPKLDSLVVAMPTFPATFYIHDLALLPQARGSGAGARAVAHLAEHTRAIGLADLSLVAVNASAPFWRRQGFEIVEDARLAASLKSYDTDARFMMRRLEAVLPL
ncbi:ribosomal protein S18 acetylase RimI-like enzyme [Pseudochelatococcus lubricantis]|uniref:Ribosomal protein S18 acetylase RimI-like enzyme n=1 Tax=Pseudochelatococcus lubricantis TaxID=1538102 RepID=A0ABX0V529_9HYPH|nr:GNAT family N-acetyltransferase [Pseudochelatococcus lubricantis]NIJ59385.1 ribosomal protein S18 acetylase RimI-like enzyme [Pseudochelatococcus lubricantis]